MENPSTAPHIDQNPATHDHSPKEKLAVLMLGAIGIVSPLLALWVSTLL